MAGRLAPTLRSRLGFATQWKHAAAWRMILRKRATVQMPIKNEQPQLVRIPPLRYMGIQGTGSPAGERFQQSTLALYEMIFAVRKALAREGVKFRIGTLEALWGEGPPPASNESWKLLLNIPKAVEQEHLNEAGAGALDSGSSGLVTHVFLTELREGRSIELLHKGAFSNQEDSLEAMRQFATARRLEFTGPLHEIYLSDAAKVAPGRLRTIMRIPVTPSRRRHGSDEG